MTNTIAAYLVLTIIAAIGLDLLFNDGAALSFLAMKFLDLLEWVIFWR